MTQSQPPKKAKTKKRRVGRPTGDPAAEELMALYGFEIDLPELVQYVHERPSLWDNRSADYKCHEKRSKAWQEVTKAIVGENAEVLNDKELHLIGEEIGKRWRSLRDRFKRDFNSARKEPSGSDAKRSTHHFLYDSLTFLTSTLALSETVCSTAGQSQEREASRQTQEESDAVMEQPPSSPARVGTQSGTLPSMRLARQRANRVEVSDLIQSTNNPLASLETALNRTTDLHTEQLGHISTALRCLQLSMDHSQQFVQRFFPQEDDDCAFLLGTLHAVRNVHPAYRQHCRVDIHSVVHQYLVRPPPPPSAQLAPQLQWGFRLLCLSLRQRPTLCKVFRRDSSMCLAPTCRRLCRAAIFPVCLHILLHVWSLHMLLCNGAPPNTLHNVPRLCQRDCLR